MQPQSNIAGLNTKRKKIAAAGALAFVLIWALTSSVNYTTTDLNASSEDLAASSAPLALSSLANPATMSTTSPTVPQSNYDSRSNDRLPKIDLARIVAHNPFLAIERDSANSSSTPLQEGQSEVSSNAKSRETSAESANQDPSQPNVSAVVTGGRKPAALINDRLYFEHDIVDDRWSIEAILPQEVIFKPASSK